MGFVTVQRTFDEIFHFLIKINAVMIRVFGPVSSVISVSEMFRIFRVNWDAK